MSPFFTNANICRFCSRPPGKWSEAGIRYNNLINPRSEIGIAEAVIEGAKHVNTQARVCTCRLRLHLFPVVKGCPRQSKETALSGGPIPRLFWSNP